MRSKFLESCGRECIMAELTVRDKCPLCRADLDVGQLAEGVLPGYDPNGAADEAASSSAGSSTVVSESKLRVLLEEVLLHSQMHIHINIYGDSAFLLFALVS